MKTLFKLLRVCFYLLILLFSIGIFLFYTFRKQIEAQAVTEINKHLNARVAIKDRKLSFVSQFPKVSFNLYEPIVFDGIKGSIDTFIVAREIHLTFDLKALLKKQIKINKLNIYDAKIKVKTDLNGISNYHIFKPSEEESQGESFAFNLEGMHLQNVEIAYINQQIEQNHLLLAHKADVLLTLNNQQLDIFLKGMLDLDHIGIKKLNYLQHKKIRINAGLNYQLNERKLNIIPSDIIVEDAKFKLNGFYTSKNPDYIDFNFVSEEGDIQTLISILPQDFTEEFKKYRSKGLVSFRGTIKGEMSHNRDPEMQFDFEVKNASIFHPETKTTLEKVNLSGAYQGQGEVSKLVIGKIDAYFGQDHISGAIRLDNLKNPYLNMDLQGKLDVPSFVNFFPSLGLKNPKGKATVDLHFQGPLHALNEIGKSAKIQTKGKLLLEDFAVDLGENRPKVQNFNAVVSFDNYNLNLEKVSGNIGNSDIQLQGKFVDFLPYIFGAKKELSIQAAFHSNHLDLDELLKSADTHTQDEAHHYHFAMSDHLNVKLDLHVKELKFRRLSGNDIGKNLSGNIIIKDRIIVYNNILFDLASGKVSTSGNVNAQNPKEIQVKNWGELKNIDVGKSIYLFEDFSQNFLTYKNLEGALNARIISELSFDSNLVLNLSKLKTNIEMQVSNGMLKDFGPMQSMRYYMKTKNMLKYLRDDDLSAIKFDTLKNTIQVENEKVIIPKMQINSSAHDFTIVGTHTFDNYMDYNVSFSIVNYQRKERLENEGVHFDEKNGKFKIFLNIKGPADNYEIIHEKQKTKEAAFQTIEQSVQRVLKEDKKDPYAGLILGDDDDDMIEID